jgi:hypothetical protein
MFKNNFDLIVNYGKIIFLCILNGYASFPQPKGPFKITANKPPPIDFKNPFFEAC